MRPESTPFSEGAPDAKILFIAEAPGRTEMIKNQPLVGPSGQIFNEALTRAGINRREVAIQNLVRTKIEDIGRFFNAKTGELTRLGEAAKADLLERIADHRPNVVVPLGGPALCALEPDSNGRIMKYRGSILLSPEFGMRKMVPSLHPAFCLPGRGPYVARYTIAQDFERIRDEGRYPERRLRKRHFIISPTFDQVMDYIGECYKHPKVGSDIETFNNHVSCLSLAYSPECAISIPFLGRNPNTSYFSESEEIAIWQALGRFYRHPDTVTVWHNGVTFDIPLLWMQNRIAIRGVEDTMVRQRILNPDFSAKLEYITSVYTDQPYYKDDKKLWARPHKDPDQFWLYNARDSAVTIECEEVMSPLFDRDEGMDWTYRDTMDCLEVALYVGLRGLRIDKRNISKLLEEITKDINTLQEELDKAAGMPLNPNSPAQVCEYFYEHLGYAAYKNRKTGNPTVDDKALSRIIRKYNSNEARLIQRLRGLKKLKGTYLEIEVDKDGRLRTTYDVRGTKTGRLSSKMTPIRTGANFQNLDPRFKKFIVIG